MASLQDNQQRSGLQITATALCATFWLKKGAPFRFSQYRQKLPAVTRANALDRVRKIGFWDLRYSSQSLQKNLPVNN